MRPSSADHQVGGQRILHLEERALREKKKEVELEGKISKLRKDRNKDRSLETIKGSLPPEKKRKLNEENYVSVKQLLKDWKVEEREEKEEETVREGKIIKMDAEKEIEVQNAQIGPLKREVPGPAGRSLGPLFPGHQLVKSRKNCANCS